MRSRISAAIVALSTPGAIALSSLSARRRFCRSAWIASATPGYWTLTATARPSLSVARWTWPIEAAAMGSGSKSANARASGRPRSSSTTPSTAPKETGSALSCRRASRRWNSGRTSSGTRPRSTADSVWPIFIAAPRMPEKTRTSACAVFRRWRSAAPFVSTRAAASRVTTPAAAPVSFPPRRSRDRLIASSLLPMLSPFTDQAIGECRTVACRSSDRRSPSPSYDPSRAAGRHSHRDPRRGRRVPRRRRVRRADHAPRRRARERRPEHPHAPLPDARATARRDCHAARDAPDRHRSGGHRLRRGARPGGARGDARPRLAGVHLARGAGLGAAVVRRVGRARAGGRFARPRAAPDRPGPRHRRRGPRRSRRAPGVHGAHGGRALHDPRARHDDPGLRTRRGRRALGGHPADPQPDGERAARPAGHRLARLALLEHLKRLGDATLSRLLALGLLHPARVLLAMGVRERVEGGARRGIAVEGGCEGVRDVDLARRGVELQLDGDCVAGLHAGPLADGGVQAEQELAAHARHGRAPRVALDGR